MSKDDRELIERLNAHSSKVPIGELRDDLRTAADTLATRLEALQAQPVGEEKPVCEHCGGNGYTGGVMPPEDMRGEYDVCCEVCLGSGKERAALTASPPVVEREAMGWQARGLIEAIAEWERENGTVAAITPDEYEGFCKRIMQAALTSSARAALSTPVAQGDEVRGALEPFVAEWRSAGADHLADDMLWSDANAVEHVGMMLTVGDFRRLATLTKGARDAG